MTSKEKIRDIKSVINEFYHQMKCEGKLTECANECWKSYQKYCDDIEKDLKQTKLNFRNSQTHSKNCYKKLKEKYEKLETANKNNEGLVRDNVKLINRNLELEKENQGVKDDNTRLWHGIEYANNEIAKLKKALDILKEKLEIQLHQDDEYFPIPMISGSEIFQNLSKEEYELLKGVLE